MLAHQYQDDQAYSEIEISPAEQFRQQWNQQPGPIPFWKQKNVIDQNAELVVYAGTFPLSGWANPRAFALQGLVLVAMVVCSLNWYFTAHSGPLQDQIDAHRAQTQKEVKRESEIMEATQAEIHRISSSAKNVFNLHMSSTPLTRQQALQELETSLEDSRKTLDQYKQRAALKEQDLKASQAVATIAYSGTPLMFSLALMMAAGMVLGGVQKDYPKNRQARRAGDFYLYFATAQGLWPNLVFLAFLHFALSGASYGLDNLFQSVGPIFWIVFWAGFGFLVQRYFVMVARDMHRVMQMRLPVNEWALDNKILLRITSSVLVMFFCLEASFISICYFLLLAYKRV
jgi:hypothetical protein